MLEIPAESLKDRLIYVIDGMDPADPMGCAAILIAELGLRVNEVCGLSWLDVDFDAGVLTLRRTYGNDGDLHGLKTTYGRTVLLTPVAAETLQRRYAALTELFRRFDLDLLDGEGADALPQRTAPVVCDEEGVRICPKEISRWWRTARVEFPMFKWSLADMRSARLVVAAHEAKAGC